MKFDTILYTCNQIKRMATLRRQTDSGIMEAYMRLRESRSLKKIGVVEEKKQSLDQVHSQTVNNLIQLKKNNSSVTRQRMSCPGRLGER